MRDRNKFLQKLRDQADGIKNRRGGFGKSFRPEDGKHNIRILDGGDFKCTDDGVYYELFQHWMKVEGKSRPFTCMAHTGVVGDANTEDCPLCTAWALLTSMKESIEDQKYLALVDKERKKLSFRSAGVMGIVLRPKPTASDPEPVGQAMAWAAPLTVTEQILTTVADLMVEDDDLDPFDPETGRDWILTRSTDNNNTTYKITMKSKPTPIGEVDGELPDLQKHYENELRSGRSSKNVEAIMELATSIVDRVFDQADEYGVDVVSFVSEWKSYTKAFNRKVAKAKAEEAAGGSKSDDEAPSRGTRKPDREEDTDDDPPARETEKEKKKRLLAEAEAAEEAEELAQLRAKKKRLAALAAAAEEEEEDDDKPEKPAKPDKPAKPFAAKETAKKTLDEDPDDDPALDEAQSAIAAAAAFLDDDDDEDDD